MFNSIGRSPRMTVFEVTKSNGPHSGRRDSRSLSPFRFKRNTSKVSSNDMNDSCSLAGSEAGSDVPPNELEGGLTNPCFITVENEHGELEHVEMEMDDNQFTVHPNHDPRKQRQSVTSSQFNDLPHIRRKPQPGNVEEDENSIVSPEIIKELSKKAKKRLVAKSGRANVSMKNVPNKSSNFLKDVFTTLIDMPWRYVILIYSLSFIITWLLFAMCYYIIGYVNGDYELDNLPNGINQKSGNFTPCVWGMYSFTSTYLFSLETQHTIGYGSRSTSEACPAAIIVTTLQGIVGCLTSTSFAGIVFAKLARPKNRSHTVMFSKNAVISMRDGALFLIFRVGNLRKSHLIEAHIRAQLVHTKEVTKEGDANYFSQQELKVSTMTEQEDDRVMLLLPTMIYHKIDHDSPFYDMSPKDILNSKFEMVISLEGIVEPTGNSVQTRTSYLPREILWGYRFVNMVGYASKPGTYMVDCSYLNALNQDDTPRLSMEQIHHARKEDRRMKQSSMTIHSDAFNNETTLLPRSRSNSPPTKGMFNPYASVIHPDHSVTIQET